MAAAVPKVLFSLRQGFFFQQWCLLPPTSVPRALWSPQLTLGGSSLQARLSCLPSHPSCQPCENHHHIWIQMGKLKTERFDHRHRSLTQPPPLQHEERAPASRWQGGPSPGSQSSAQPHAALATPCWQEEGRCRRGSGWADRIPAGEGQRPRPSLPSPPNQLVLTPGAGPGQQRQEL